LISKRMTEFGMFKFLKLFGVLQKNQRNNWHHLEESAF
jgi:hypothetical protein